MVVYWWQCLDPLFASVSGEALSPFTEKRDWFVVVVEVSKESKVEGKSRDLTLGHTGTEGSGQLLQSVAQWEERSNVWCSVLRCVVVWCSQNRNQRPPCCLM